MTAIVHGQSGEPSHRGRETGTSAVRGMVSKINLFCNEKESSGGALAALVDGRTGQHAWEARRPGLAP